MKKSIFGNKIIALLLCLCIACTLMLVSCNKENGESGATEAGSESASATEKSTDDGINRLLLDGELDVLVDNSEISNENIEAFLYSSEMLLLAVPKFLPT